MRRVKPALLRSCVALALLSSGCSRQQGGAPSPDVTDECRYTVLKPERQQLRTWDGGFLDEALPCFGRSLCVAGAERTRVYRSAPERLTIEVGERRYERTARTGRIRRVPHYRGLSHAIVGNDAVALVHERDLEVLTAEGEARFPLPELEPGEAYGGPVLVADGVGLSLVEHEDQGLPVRPFLWLKRPSAGAAEGTSAAGWPLVCEREVIGRLERGSDGWRVVLTRGFAATVAPPSPVPPGVWVGRDELLVVQDDSVRVIGYDGARSALELSDEDALVEVADRYYRVSVTDGVERLRGAGAETVIPRAPGHDLAGARLPDGAVVERLQESGDEERRIAVLERIRLPGCRVEDRLHIVDVEARTVRTIANDDRVRLHPRFTRGRLHVVEAEAVYEVVAGL